MRASSPIGVFDSGIGGLTILKELRRALPGEHLIYIGDLARSPYGSKSPEAVRRYASQITAYLLSRDVKLIVVACNTASATAGDRVRQLARPVPVVEVVKYGAARALDRVRGLGKKESRIGILGTETTVASGIYPAMIDRLAKVRNERPPRLLQKACPLFVPLAEEGFWKGRLPSMVARIYLKEMRAFRPHAVILGCTHYPLLKATIARALPAGTRLVESAPAVVSAVEATLDATGTRAPRTGGGITEYYASDSVDLFRRMAGRFLDTAVDLVHHIDLDACEDREG